MLASWPRLSAGIICVYQHTRLRSPPLYKYYIFEIQTFSRTILLIKGICKWEINLLSRYHPREPPIRKLHNSTENSPGDTSGFCTYTVPLHTSSARFLVPITDQPFHTEAFVQSKKKVLIFYVLLGQDWRHSGEWDSFKEQKNHFSKESKREQGNNYRNRKLGCDQCPGCLRTSWLCMRKGHWQGG